MDYLLLQKLMRPSRRGFGYLDSLFLFLLLCIYVESCLGFVILDSLAALVLDC